jgi:hypothetical protein
MSRRERRAFRSDARRYLTTDADGIASVAAAAEWLGTLPFIQDLGLSDLQCRKLVTLLRSENCVMFAPDDEIKMVKLIEIDGAALSPLTILAALRRISG